MAAPAPLTDLLSGAVFAAPDSPLRRDPYPVLHQLRAADPICRFEPLVGWILSRYDDICRVLRDPRFSKKPGLATVEQRRREVHDLVTPEQRPALDAFFGNSVVFLDPPEHTRLRGLVSKGFTPRMVSGLRPRIQALVDELVDGLLERGHTDFMRDFADPLPAIVIAELLGIPVADRERFKRWSDGLVILFDPFPPDERRLHALECAREMHDYMRDLFAERRRAPGDDLVSALVMLEAEGDALSEPELYGMSMLLLAAGHETTTNLLGNGMLALLEHPGELKRLRDDPGLLRTAVEELLRFDSPVQGMPRVALEDCEFEGREFQKGDYIILLVGAGNRDPEQFPDPDRLDVGRPENRHLAFGLGAHFCLGAPLARLEGEIAFETLLRRVPRLDLDAEALRWRQTLVLRGLEALPMRFAA